ncbi:MAG: class I SAM-dependent methyltransferase [bacterium]
MALLKRANYFYHWLKQEYLGSESTKDIYGKLAREEKYDFTVDYHDRVETYKKALKKAVPKFDSVLDIACGTGAMIDALEPEDHHQVKGIDITPEMLVEARKRFGHRNNISLHEQSFMEADFPVESFDLITVGYATRFVPKGSEQLFAKNVAKWMTKGGYLFAIVQPSIVSGALQRFEKMTGYPKGLNLAMHLEKPFIKHMEKHLEYVQTVPVEWKYLVVKGVAVVMQKRN